MTSNNGDENGLFICNLDPVSLEVTSEVVWLVPEGPTNPIDVVSVYNGENHIVAWIEEMSGQNLLKMGRVLPNLLTPDPGGYLIDEYVQAEGLDLCADANGGWLSWITQTGELFIKRIDAAGLTTGSSILIDAGTPSSHTAVKIAPLGEKWLLTWFYGDNPPQYAVINQTGEIQAPGVISLVSGSAYWGLAACSNDDYGFIAWRGGNQEGVFGSRISEEGEMLDQPPILISTFDLFELQNSEFRSNLDCEWTGDHFVTQWTTWMLNKGDVIERSGDFPVFAQWINPDGSVEYTEPVAVNQGSWPIDIASVFVDDQILSCVVDEGSRDWLHLVKTDTAGAVVGEPIRYQATNDRATAILAVEGRPATNGAIFSYIWKAEYYHDWWTYITTVILDTNGEELYKGTNTLAHNTNSVSVDYWDMVEAGESAIVGFDWHNMGNDSMVYYKWLGVRNWYVVPEGSEAFEPTICKINDNYLTVWVEDHGAARRLYWTNLELYSGGAVVGECLLDSDGSQRQPFLIEGADQVLCIFIMALPGSDTGADVYAVRMEPDGTLIDTEPILICTSPENLWNTRGTWDGTNYVLTWTSSEFGFDLFSTRLSPEGVVLDTEAVYLGDYQYDPGRPASDGNGHTVVAYNQNRIVTFPFGSTDAEENPRGNTNLYLGHPAPNPAGNNVSFSWNNPDEHFLQAEILDVTGRRIYLLPQVDQSSTGLYSWNGYQANGQFAPGGVYYVRLSGGAEVVTRKFVVLR